MAGFQSTSLIVNRTILYHQGGKAILGIGSVHICVNDDFLRLFNTEGLLGEQDQAQKAVTLLCCCSGSESWLVFW